MGQIIETEPSVTVCINEFLFPVRHPRTITQDLFLLHMLRLITGRYTYPTTLLGEGWDVPSMHHSNRNEHFT